MLTLFCAACIVLRNLLSDNPLVQSLKLLTVCCAACVGLRVGLQILLSDNPLTRPGLTLVQALLFWEAAVHHFLALPTVLLSLLPLIYMFTEVRQRGATSALHIPFLVAPLLGNMWQCPQSC